MQAWVFFIILAVFAVGMVWGFLIGRSRNASQRRAETLEVQLSELRGEMAEYRQQVGQHFSKTADVVNAMTTNYRALYDQLIKGAQALCGEQITYTKLNASDMHFIEHQGDKSNGGAAPVDDAVPQPQGDARSAMGANAAGEAAPRRTEPSIPEAMDRRAEGSPRPGDPAAGVDGQPQGRPAAPGASDAAGGGDEYVEGGRAPAPSGGAEAKAAVTDSLTIH